MIIKILLVAFFSWLWVLPVQAATNSCLYFFYNDDCGACIKTKPFLASLSENYPNLEIRYTSVPENLDLLTQFFEHYQAPSADRGIPVVFIGQHYLIGSQDIPNKLEDIILNEAYHNCWLANTSQDIPSAVNQPAVNKINDQIQTKETKHNDLRDVPIISLSDYEKDLETPYIFYGLVVLSLGALIFLKFKA